MKNTTNNITIGKRASLLMLALLISSFFIGCTKIEIAHPNAIPNESDSAFVLLSISTPQATLPSSLKQTQTTNETEIAEVKVLIFEWLEDEYYFNHAVSAVKNQESPEQVQFKIPLLTTNKKLKLILLANANDVFENATIEYGYSEAQVRKQLNKTFSAIGLSNNLPMYGETIFPNGVNATETYTISVSMLRAIARIDVVKDLKEGATEFILDELYAFRANNKIQLIPDALSSNTPPKVSEPSIPENIAALSEAIALIEDDSEAITQLYLPESEAATTSNEQLFEATTLVVGGRLGGSENPISYYRIDFNSGIEGHPFGQILRNHRYIFKIKDVSAGGWSTPSEAANNLSGSITIDVETWEDFVSDIYFDNDHFGVSTREISLRYIKNRYQFLDIESSGTYQIQWLDETGNPTGETTSELNTLIRNEHFDAVIVKYPYDEELVSHILFITRNHNNLGNVISDKLRITYKNKQIDIIVKQDNSAMYSTFIAKVLTVDEIGNLGENLVNGDASGEAMRKVLDMQFALNGIIKIGGFSFTRIPSRTNYVGTSAPENLAVMSRIIGAHDVIYFPYNVSISSEVADLLLNWLDESSHRVLIIGTDSDGTNKALREKAKIAADGTWEFSNVTTISSNYLRASSSSQTEDFFNGPFGFVEENASFKRSDRTAGYCSNYSTNVIPLIVADKQNYTNYMFFGVNKKNRIIYHGDGNLFQTSQMSNNNGYISNSLDVLMANTWAWIIEQVIYGAQ